MVTRKETQKEIGKIKKLRILYFVMLLLLFCVGVALLVIFIDKGGITDLLLAVVAWIWCVMLIYQLFRTRELIAMMNAHLERLSVVEAEEESPAVQEGSVPEEGDGDEP